SDKTRYRTGGHANSADRAGIESGLGDARVGRAPRAMGDCWWCARPRRSARARNSNGLQAAESDRFGVILTEPLGQTATDAHRHDARSSDFGFWRFSGVWRWRGW